MRVLVVREAYGRGTGRQVDTQPRLHLSAPRVIKSSGGPGQRVARPRESARRPNTCVTASASLSLLFSQMCSC